MKTRPILFSAPMVRALLAGTKTQTRRAVRKHPWASCCIEEGFDGESPFVYSALSGDGPGHDVDETRTPCRCPFGIPGDRLWVREKHALQNRYRNVWCRYAADNLHVAVPAPAFVNIAKPGWRSPIFMPRWASRITLEVTGVRVERLAYISEANSIAEGITRTHDGYGWHTEDGRHYMADPRDSYASLWETINGAGSWDANPWVWVVDFKRI